jgi:hypothetical protein
MQARHAAKLWRYSSFQPIIIDFIFMEIPRLVGVSIKKDDVLAISLSTSSYHEFML